MTAYGIDLACHNQAGGSWQFATAPQACNVSPLLDSKLAQNEYESVIFDESKNDRSQYMSAMFSALREVSRSYIRRRNPAVSQQEETGFLEAVFTLAHQESFWSHYRQGSDQIIRYMRGDSLHGHGLMQIDDRSHVDALKQGRGVDLVYNIIYGLDIFYDAWLKSAKSSCIKSSTDYVSRARAAWSAYNGGPGSICRWSKSPSSGDQQFHTKIIQKAWLQLVKDQNAPSQLDIQCLMEGLRPCKGSAPPSFSPLAFAVGDHVQITALSGINFRASINGKIIRRLERGQIVLVDDIAELGKRSDIYLKITYQAQTGYIYAGQKLPQLTTQDWVQAISGQPLALKSNINYEFLKTCGASSCAKTSFVLEGLMREPLAIIQKNDQGWVEVKNGGQKKGWIAERDLEEIR